MIPLPPKHSVQSTPALLLAIVSKACVKNTLLNLKKKHIIPQANLHKLYPHKLKSQKNSINTRGDLVYKTPTRGEY